MSYLMSIFLGFVQGIAEFLPISSSGHLSILQNVFHVTSEGSSSLFFDVMLHFGTLVAVLVSYRKDIVSMIKETLDFLSGSGDGGKDYAGRLKPSVRTAIFIVAGTLPLIFVFPIKDKIDKLSGNTTFVALALIITGTLLYICDKLHEGRKSAKTFTLMDAVIIGFSQALATLPGISRSGTTITVGVSRGLRRDFAVNFSFLLSIPAVLAAFLLEVVDAIKGGISASILLPCFLGMLVSGITGYFAIRLVKKLTVGGKFKNFAYYCWGVGLVTFIASFFI